MLKRIQIVNYVPFRDFGVILVTPLSLRTGSPRSAFTLSCSIIAKEQMLVFFFSGAGVIIMPSAVRVAIFRFLVETFRSSLRRRGKVVVPARTCVSGGA